MALPCQSCADVSETVAMVFSVPKLYERIGNGSYDLAIPKLCGRIGNGSYSFAVSKLCSIEQTGREAEAKIGGILALRR